jgi:hypothetical protein
MVDNYKVVSVTPAGRKRYIEVLHKYLINCKHIIDNHIWWINTDNQEDIEYIQSLVQQFPKFYSLKFLPDHPNYKFNNMNIHKFFDDCKDENTVYVRFDDDIVFIETEKLEDFLRFRINNPQYFIVYANIINNNFCSYIHQRLGAIGAGEFQDFNELPLLEYVFENDTLTQPNYTLINFQAFFKKISQNALSDYKFPKWVFHQYERCSINCISWLGSEFAKFDHVGIDEEPWLSSYKPRERFMKNCVYGNFIVVHYSYGSNRERIDNYNDGILMKLFHDVADKQNPS